MVECADRFHIARLGHLRGNDAERDCQDEADSGEPVE
jgi:hypothetical protein